MQEQLVSRHSAQEQEANSKNSRLAVVLTVLILYILLAVTMVLVSLFGVLLLASFHNRNAVEFIDTFYWLTFKSLVVAIATLFISCFYYRLWMKWVLCIITLIPILLGIIFSIYFLDALEKESKPLSIKFTESEFFALS